MDFGGDGIGGIETAPNYNAADDDEEEDSDSKNVNCEN